MDIKDTLLAIFTPALFFSMLLAYPVIVVLEELINRSGDGD